MYFIPSNPEILEENSDDVVLSGDVAQETIVVTTTDDESVGDFVESHIVPIGNLDVLNTIELSCDDNFQSSLETSDLGWVFVLTFQYYWSKFLINLELN